jgi:hypothetical protein
MERLGSNSVSAPLCGRRLPAIFPKRCKAGGQAGSSWGGHLGGGLGRALPVGVAGSPGALLSPGVLVGLSWVSSVAGRGGRLVGRAWCGAVF